MTYCVTLYGFHFLNEFPLSLDPQHVPREPSNQAKSQVTNDLVEHVLIQTKQVLQEVGMSTSVDVETVTNGITESKQTTSSCENTSILLCTNIYCFAYFWKIILTFTIYFRCQILTCLELKPPENGRFVHYPCSNVFNSACGIQCLPGFELQSGSSVRMCLPNGQWSGTQPRYTMYIIVLQRIYFNKAVQTSTFLSSRRFCGLWFLGSVVYVPLCSAYPINKSHTFFQILSPLYKL